MTIQVVNSENLVEFVKTGKVPEFKPPEANTAPADDAKKSDAAPKSEAKPAPDAKATETPRNDRGQFTKQTEGDKSSATAATAGDDEGGDDLPERAKAQIGKKHRLWKEAQEREQVALRRAQEAERRAAEAERKLGGQPKSEPAQAEEDPPPKAEDFKTIAEYVNASVEFELKKRDKTAAKQREAQRQSEVENAFTSRMRSAQEKYPDFAEVLDGITGTDLDQAPVAMIQYIQEVELGPDLLYHLIKHPATLDRIRRLSGPRMFAELGKLEDKLAEAAPKDADPPAKTEQPAPKQPERQVSKAPAPIAPLDTAGASPVAKKPEDMSVTELREHRRLEAQERRSQGRA